MSKYKFHIFYIYNTNNNQANNSIYNRLLLNIL